MAARENKNSRMALALVLLGSLTGVRAFYLPGVAPTDYKPGETLHVKVEALTSTRTQLPYEYYVLPFCRDGVDLSHQEALNLGEVLRGSRIFNTPYKFAMGEDLSCRILCQKTYTQEEVQEFALMIEEDYRSHFLVDNLPVAMSVFHEADDGQTIKAYETGYPIGHAVSGDAGETDSPGAPRQAGPPKIVLFNHLRFTILVHEDLKRGTRRVVGFEVEPFSVRHTYENQIDFSKCVGKQAGENHQCALNTCSRVKPVSARERPLLLDVQKKGKTEVIWTYDVAFKPSTIKWSTRWDTYLQSADDAEVHWFSILNSFMIVLFLSGLIAMILLRTLKADFERYDGAVEAGEEETGWKLVHGDVFRAPAMAGWLSVITGSGLQLAVSAVFLMLFACFGFLSPANRGALMQAMLFIFVFMGMVGGYTAARLFRLFKGTRWKENALFTALVFPGVIFCVFFVLNLVVWSQRSSGAVPFTTLFALLCMWLLISAPLVVAGAYFGFRKSPITLPVRTNQIPRQVPAQPWFSASGLTVLIGGVLPFGAVFVEGYYVLSSVWLHQFYYMFGFLFLVLVILLLTCAEVTIVMVYFQLCSENYHWWWRAFTTAGCCSGYIFVYSVYYAFSRLQMARTAAFLVYLGYMGVVSLTIFLICGSLGLLASFLFVRQIYGAIKIE